MLVLLGSTRDVETADFSKRDMWIWIIKCENGKQSVAGHRKLHLLLWQWEVEYRSLNSMIRGQAEQLIHKKGKLKFTVATVGANCIYIFFKSKSRATEWCCSTDRSTSIICAFFQRSLSRVDFNPAQTVSLYLKYCNAMIIMYSFNECVKIDFSDKRTILSINMGLSYHLD